MKKLGLILIFLSLCVFSITAQVTTSYFRNKDAYDSFPALSPSLFQDFPIILMPQVDTEKLIREDLYLEGFD